MSLMVKRPNGHTQIMPHKNILVVELSSVYSSCSWPKKTDKTARGRQYKI